MNLQFNTANRKFDVTTLCPPEVKAKLIVTLSQLCAIFEIYELHVTTEKSNSSVSTGNNSGTATGTNAKSVHNPTGTNNEVKAVKD